MSNNLGADGGKAIAAVLPQTKITTLLCAPPSHPHSPVARALLTPAAGPVHPHTCGPSCPVPPHHTHPPPDARRLYGNNLTKKGEAAIRKAASTFKGDLDL